MPGLPFQTSLSLGSLMEISRHDAIRIAGDAGFSAVEIECQPPHLSLEDAQQERTLVQLELQVSKIEVSAFSIGTHFTHPAEAAKSRAELLRWLEIAESYEVSLLRILPGPPASADATLEEWGTLVEHLTPCVERAGERNIQLAVATQPGMLTDSIQSILMLLDCFDAPSLGICLDPSTIALADENIESSIAQINERIMLCRLRDMAPLTGDAKPEWKPLGHGMLPHATILRALREVGYAGHLTVALSDARHDGLSVADAARLEAGYLKRLMECYA